LLRVVVRGAGEMATGVIVCLREAGYAMVALEQASPVCVRRAVCLAEAVCQGRAVVEGITAVLATSVEDALVRAAAGEVPVLVDPEARLVPALKPEVVIDARMLKRDLSDSGYRAPIVIGLGPGFVAGDRCTAVIETQRGPDLGAVIMSGRAQSYSGVPAPVAGVGLDRVLRSPGDGPFTSTHRIGDAVPAGAVVGHVGGVPVASAIGGVVRGLARNGLQVTNGQKIGDIDPRGEIARCFRISHKARAIGHGVLTALVKLKAPDPLDVGESN
jgi:xanthine dehydrogenase accessory factor